MLPPEGMLPAIVCREFRGRRAFGRAGVELELHPQLDAAPGSVARRSSTNADIGRCQFSDTDFGTWASHWRRRALVNGIDDLSDRVQQALIIRLRSASGKEAEVERLIRRCSLLAACARQAGHA